MQNTLLVVEDEKDLLLSLKEILSESGFIVNTTSEGSQALLLVKKIQPDLVVLDLGLPDVDGETICRELKKSHPATPVIILTAHDTTEDVVRGLNVGADDYITKPFVPEELVARIRASLRVGKQPETKFKVDGLEMNTQTFEVRRDGKIIPLTHTEFQLLSCLIHNKGQVLTREVILNHVWSYTPDIESRVVDVYVGYLRKKIDTHHKKKLIHSVRGFGYVLREES